MKLGKKVSGPREPLVVAVALLFLWVATADAETLTRTVQDETGRTVRVPEHIGRIVSLAPNLTEMVYALGVEERLVGITNQCDYPPEVKVKPRVGDVIQPSLETIVELRPAVVLGATEVAKGREEIEKCIEGSKRIAATLRGLINYARPGPLMLSQVSLAQMVEDAVAFLEHQPLFRNISLENRIPPGIPSILADSNQLSQVLMNLLLNAAQAMPNGGRITISAESIAGEKIQIRIEDTGTGIPEDVLPHIFEPFFTTKRGKGTGLGLSITQAYVRSHGGEIEVHTVPEKGTIVCVTMPLRQEVREELAQQEVIG